MRNKKHGRLTLKLIDSQRKLLRGLLIQIAAGLVEDEDFWPVEQDPGNGQPLFLATGQAHTTLTQRGLDP